MRWLGLLCCLLAGGAAAEVANLAVQQQDGRLVIRYDLEEEKAAEVSALIAVDGRLYNQDSLRLEGDVGRSVAPGKDRRIVWDVLRDLPGGITGEVFVSVRSGPRRLAETDVVSLSEQQAEIFRRIDAEGIDAAGANRRTLFTGTAPRLAAAIDERLASSYYQEIDSRLLDKSRYYCARFPETPPPRTDAAPLDTEQLASRWESAKRSAPVINDENHARYFNCLLGSFDPHSAYLTPEEYRDLQAATKGVFGGLGMELTLKRKVVTVVAPIEDTPAFRVGIKAGDQILAIDWRSTQDMPLTEAVKLMRGQKGTKVTLTIGREGAAPFQVPLVRDVITVRSVRSRLLDGGYGYLRIVQFQERTADDVGSALVSLREAAGGNLKGLVIDLRNDPGGLLNQAVAVASRFVDQGLIVYTQGRERDANQQHAPQRVSREPPYPVVVLVNGGSASASEIVAGALQDHRRAVVAGLRTFGKGSVQTILPTEGGAIKLTTALYYTPNGRSIQQVGIVPDIPLEQDLSTDEAAAAFGRRLLLDAPGIADPLTRKAVADRAKVEEFFTLYKDAVRSSIAVHPATATVQAKAAPAAGAKPPKAAPAPEAGPPGADEKRVALVIGNGAYPSSPLKNPVNDARAISGKLKALGFEVITRENVAQKDMTRAITQFGEKLARKGAVGLFYYAGHGMQVRGKNYLIPVDAQISSEASVRSEAIDVDAMLEQLSTSALGIVILDACRNNPFERRFRGAAGGLAQMDAPKGTLIAYATAPGKVASDGDGKNGLYTQELLKVLDERGLKVEDVFKRVRRQVADATADQQVPWESSSLTGDFYFAGAADAGKSSDAELLFWQTIKQSTDIEDFNAYLRRYPNGQFVDIAKIRIRKLGAK
ncbi:MAG: S41 family peptidase [Sterolibacteriaceae bacterium MAG5]|nr:S41 family peptidase [Candidatus Nitricoxidireducens bremensis]